MKQHKDASPGTTSTPYQNLSNGIKGGDASNKGSVGGFKQVANGGKKSNPQSARNAEPGSMKPDFYPGTADNKCGTER